jgi:tetratricopeptide (TPR) repeat protein
LFDDDLSEAENRRIIKKLGDLIDKEPGNELAYYYRGVAFIRLEEYQAAINDMSKAIELNPEYLQAYNARGVLYVFIYEYNKALDDFNRAIKLDSGNIKTYLNRGIAKYFLRQYEESIKDCDYVLEREPNNEKVMSFKALVYYRLEKYQEAVDVVKKAAEIDNNKEYYYMLGELFFKMEDYPEAFRCFNFAINLNNEYQPAFNSRGLIYQKWGEHDEAINDFTEAIRLSNTKNIPKYIYLNGARAYYNRAKSYDDLARYQAAISDLDAASKIYPSHAAVYILRGEIYEKMSAETKDTNLADRYKKKAQDDFGISKKLSSEDGGSDDPFLQFSPGFSW